MGVKNQAMLSAIASKLSSQNYQLKILGSEPKSITQQLSSSVRIHQIMINM